MRPPPRAAIRGAAARISRMGARTWSSCSARQSSSVSSSSGAHEARPRVVDEHVDAAHLLGARRDDALVGVGVGDVGGDVVGAVAELLRGGRERRLVAPDQQHARALRDEPAGGLQADAAAGPGDDADLVPEFEVHRSGEATRHAPCRGPPARPRRPGGVAGRRGARAGRARRRRGPRPAAPRARPRPRGAPPRPARSRPDARRRASSASPSGPGQRYALRLPPGWGVSGGPGARLGRARAPRRRAPPRPSSAMHFPRTALPAHPRRPGAVAALGDASAARRARAATLTERVAPARAPPRRRARRGRRPAPHGRGAGAALARGRGDAARSSSSSRASRVHGRAATIGACASARRSALAATRVTASAARGRARDGSRRLSGYAGPGPSPRARR